ncbi:hypothetical protein ACFE04_005779 [Oxalis oulophora]
MNPQSKPQILTLYEDHVCKHSQTPEPDQLGENSQSATVTENPTPEDLEVFNLDNVLVDSPTISSDSPHGTSNEVKDNKLPTTVAWILDVESSPMSLEFHPDLQTLLLVGTSNEDIGLWEVNSGEKLFSKIFKLWDIRASTMKLKTALIRDPTVSVNRVIWSPDGFFFAVAFSKHIFHLYSYQNANIVQPHLEIDAHIGGVNDLAFSTPHKQLLVISCGDDMAVKVWDVKSGSRMYSFESHNAPVFSLCSHIKENVDFLLSNSVDGKIKVWLFENSEAKVDFDGPAQGPSRMIYADSTRIFSSGVGKDGKSFLLEYHEGEGSIIREYQGFSEGSLSPKIFDTTQGWFLAVGDDHAVKIWEMDSVELKTIIDAGGDLPENPFVRFNKEGTLLAVAAKENLIKILATEDYLQSLLKPESSVHLSTVLSDSPNKVAPRQSGSSFMVIESSSKSIQSDSSGEIQTGSKLQGLVSSLMSQKIGSGVLSSTPQFSVANDVQSQMIKLLSSHLESLVLKLRPLASELKEILPKSSYRLRGPTKMLYDVNRGDTVDAKIVSEMYTFRVSVEGLRNALNNALRAHAKKCKTTVAVVDAGCLAGIRKHWNTCVPSELNDKKWLFSDRAVVVVGAGATAVVGVSSLSKLVPASTLKVLTYNISSSLNLMLTQTHKAMSLSFSNMKVRTVAHNVIASAEKTRLSAMRTAFHEIMRTRRVRPVGVLPWATFGGSMVMSAGLLRYGDGLESVAESLPAAPSIANLGRGIQSLQRASETARQMDGFIEKIENAIESLMYKLKKGEGYMEGESLREDEEEFVLLDLDDVSEHLDIPPDATYLLSGLDTLNPVLTIGDNLKLVGEYEETIGTCIVFTEDESKPVVHEETGPSEVNLFNGKHIIDSSQAPKKQVKPIASLQKILKFRFAPDVDIPDSVANITMPDH